MSNGLDVAYMRDPYGEWDPERGDRHSEIAFGDDEWWFFYKSLGARVADYIEGEPIEDYNERCQRAFQEPLTAYPLLARVHEFYQDARFRVDEIVAL